MSLSDKLLRTIGGLIARHLTKRLKGYSPPATSRPDALMSTLQAGDILLVEGDTRVSVAIKYLTQSTWSHAALFVGNRLGRCDSDGEALVLIEADVVDGVRAVPLSIYANHHTRICRPVGLPASDIERVVDFAIARLGNTYDLKNLIDLARYLFPLAPVPTRTRRHLLELGSGEPTHAICSTLIAQAFQSVRYPILPYVEDSPVSDPLRKGFFRKGMRPRHFSLFTPRDFDISPYFRIVKPQIEPGFDPKSIPWVDNDLVLVSVPAAPDELVSSKYLPGD